jgi:HPt (histidine-containing phosphotransfer) domain-containing protein
MNISNVDTADGLTRAMNNKDLYFKLLASFLRGCIDQKIQLIKAMEIADISTLSRISHALKGSAAMIGARELASRAAALEKALYLVADNDTLLDKYEYFTLEFDIVRQNIKEFLESQGVA